jgi:hypothetical protein
VSEACFIFCYLLRKLDVTANAKKTTTENKVNDSNIIPTAHSSTFGFCRHANPKQKTKRA